MADIVDERADLKATMRDVPINVQDLTDSPDVPAVIVLPDAPVDWHLTFGDDARRHKFRVLILVPYNDTENAQRQLDGFLAGSGRFSIAAAIEANPQFQVDELRAYEVISLVDGGTRYLAAELLVESFAA